MAALVIVLALGVLGAAYATGMDFSNVGALSAGEAAVVQVNTDHVGFLSAPNGSCVDRIALSFDRDLAAGSTIWVTIVCKTSGWIVLSSFLDQNDEVIVSLTPPLPVWQVPCVSSVMVTVAER
jgi:hypothetical protein